MFCALLLYNVDMDMQIITSLSNAHVKCVRGLKQKKNRIETGLFIADGDLLTIEALQSGAITVLQHREAIEACEKLEKFLRENSTAVLDWCSAMQRKLKREMPV